MIEEKELNRAYKISDDPREFNWEIIERKIFDIVNKIINKEKLAADDHCECSRFEIIDLINLAMRGDIGEKYRLYTGKKVDKLSILKFVNNLCMYIWRDICKHWEQKESQKTSLEKIQESIACQTNELIAT